MLVPGTDSSVNYISKKLLNKLVWTKSKINNVHRPIGYPIGLSLLYTILLVIKNIHYYGIQWIYTEQIYTTCDNKFSNVHTKWYQLIQC